MVRSIGFLWGCVLHRPPIGHSSARAQTQAGSTKGPLAPAVRLALTLPNQT